MIEFDVDMSYLLECDELDKVVLNDENGEHEPMEFVPKAATVGNRSCASCPEMDNPDSYIVHLHRALEVADSGAGTCHNTNEHTNVFECSECGYWYDFVTDPYQGPNFCPRCGKRIEVKND